ncbi:MAG: hypothetical protein LAP85_03550 [Acidobacteriia bacterium]|nr:hypothetical protein [Terriglobia bacterium]
MADDFGRVNPVSRHFLDRGAREEPYQGRHSKKHQGHVGDSADVVADEVAEESAADAPAAGNHIDLRI